MSKFESALAQLVGLELDEFVNGYRRGAVPVAEEPPARPYDIAPNRGAYGPPEEWSLLGANFRAISRKI